ncbi:AbrB/MazE/SpoVT family DNA-binding domain-containing protein [Agrobacterium pusense]|uniref:AbrB/MazE/SpoVT family DNA-binding domain-containing protein n=1 Tax=Agrobacterium pusense TaxID=648995 RepID=UPI003FCF0153
MKINLITIGEDTGFVIPKQIIERLGWQAGDVLNLNCDGNLLELRAHSASEHAADDFNRQLERARHVMRKYHVALKALADS